MTALRVALAALLLVAGFYGLYKFIERPQSQFLGPTITRASGAHTLALTYDDGPNPPDTDALLAVLRAHHAHATFFVNGIAAIAAPHTLQTMAADDDEIENHGWDHGHLEALLTRAQIDDQLDRTDAAIARATGRHSQYVRPPYGLRDRALIDEARRRGYATVMWTGTLVGDWDPLPAHTIAERIISQARDGAILVMHDGDRGRGGDRRRVVAATEEILTVLQARGYRFVTLDRLLHA